jgi:hypothetical protein
MKAHRRSAKRMPLLLALTVVSSAGVARAQDMGTADPPPGQYDPSAIDQTPIVDQAVDNSTQLLRRRLISSDGRVSFSIVDGGTEIPILTPDPNAYVVAGDATYSSASGATLVCVGIATQYPLIAGQQEYCAVRASGASSFGPGLTFVGSADGAFLIGTGANVGSFDFVVTVSTSLDLLGNRTNAAPCNYATYTSSGGWSAEGTNSRCAPDKIPPLPCNDDPVCWGGTSTRLPDGTCDTSGLVDVCNDGNPLHEWYCTGDPTAPCEYVSKASP